MRCKPESYSYRNIGRDRPPIHRRLQNHRFAQAGLLTCSGFSAFPVRRPVAQMTETFCTLAGRSLQQRELLPIFTAFPFNP